MLRRYRSHNLQILCRCLAFVGYFFVLNSLPLIEGAQAGLFNGRDVNENIPPTSARRLNKSVPFGRVEPLHGDTANAQGCQPPPLCVPKLLARADEVIE